MEGGYSQGGQPASRGGEWLCKTGSSKTSLSFLYFSSVLCVSTVAMPTGYKIVYHMHSGCMAFIALSPLAASQPRASVQYMYT